MSELNDNYRGSNNKHNENNTGIGGRGQIRVRGGRGIGGRCHGRI